MKLMGALQNCTLGLLRRIAAGHSIPIEEDALRAELAEKIFARLTDPGYVTQYLSQLSSNELRQLQVVKGYGWIAKAFLLEHGPGSYNRSKTEEQADRPGLSLLHRGLLFRSFASLGSWRGQAYYVPEELQPAISTLENVASALERPSVEAEIAPDLVEEVDPAFDVFCLLSFLRRHDCPKARDGLSRADLLKLDAESAGGSRAATVSVPKKWDFLLRVCLAAGWVRAGTFASTAPARGNVLKPGRAAAAMLSEGRAQVRAKLLERYLRDRSWSDLAAAGKARPVRGGRAIDEPEARHVLLHYLSELAGSGWADEVAFRDALRALGPDFLREDYCSPASAVIEAASGVESYGEVSWELVEGEWISCLLHGPLRWLGSVRWGRTLNGSKWAFRLVSQGDGGQTRVEERDAAPDLVVAEDGSVLARAGADLGNLLRLEPYLELRHRGQESSYRLTRASVLAGLEQGGSWRELRELLLASSHDAVPGAVLSSAEEWASDYGRFSLEGALLLRLASPEDAMLLRGNPQIERCLQSRLGPTAYAIVPERLWELADRLRAAGQVPRLGPSARAHAIRGVATDSATLRASLFSLLVLRSLYPDALPKSTGAAIRRLEAALGPEDAAEILGEAEEAAKRLR